MMRRLIVAALTLATACESDGPERNRAPAPEPAPPVAADRVEVQHILIGFRGSVPGKAIARSQADARALAADTLKRAREGADFDALVKEHTDDRAPGIYAMSNRGVSPRPGESSREMMVKAFGDVSFSLKVGEIGMAEYDPETSKFGWHIIKRLK